MGKLNEIHAVPNILNVIAFHIKYICVLLSIKFIFHWSKFEENESEPSVFYMYIFICGMWTLEHR